MTTLHTFNGLFSRTTRVSRYQKDKINLDFTEAARDSEWQWHQLGHNASQVCSAPRSKQITTPARHHSVFLQAGCHSCRPTNSVKALKANLILYRKTNKMTNHLLSINISVGGVAQWLVSFGA